MEITYLGRYGARQASFASDGCNRILRSDVTLKISVINGRDTYCRQNRSIFVQRTSEQGRWFIVTIFVRPILEAVVCQFEH